MLLHCSSVYGHPLCDRVATHDQDSDVSLSRPTLPRIAAQK